MTTAIRLFLAGLISVSLAAATPCASAHAACPTAHQQACGCGQQDPGAACAMGCADQPASAGTVTAILAPAGQHGWLLSATPHHLAADLTPPAPAAIRLASSVQPAFHAPPLRRYLLTCTFRL